MLKAEISALDTRVERGISTLLIINALVLAVIYLDVVPWFEAGTFDTDTLSAVELPVFLIVVGLNLILGLRYYGTTKHIDIIGGYIARIEAEVYRDEAQSLGWELSLRGDNPVGLVKKDTWIDRFRRLGFWVFLAVVNLAVLLDLTCFITLSGVTACPQP